MAQYNKEKKQEKNKRTPFFSSSGILFFFCFFFFKLEMTYVSMTDAISDGGEEKVSHGPVPPPLFPPYLFAGHMSPGIRYRRGRSGYLFFRPSLIKTVWKSPQKNFFFYKCNKCLNIFFFVSSRPIWLTVSYTENMYTYTWLMDPLYMYATSSASHAHDVNQKGFYDAIK